MPVEWSTSPPELVLRVNRDAPGLLRDQLERALREAVRDGRLARGERLPSSRALAAQLGVARGVVTDCYAQLQAEGYLQSRHGAGTWVAEGVSVTEAAPPPAASVELRYDLRPGVPDLASFPRADWLRCLREACRDAPHAMLGYPDGAGVPELRDTIAGYLRRVRNADARASGTIVTSGFAQGLGLVLRALADQGVTSLAVEDPGDQESHELAAGLGLRVVPTPVDAEGVVVDELGGARAVLVTPAHQSPTGVQLSARRRRDLVSWARENDAVILEDDYDAELRYGGEPVGALQGLAPDRVVLLGSVSKALAPGLRLGWVLCPPDLAGAVASAKARADRGSPVLDQLALARLVRSGAYDRHLRRMRAVYAERRSVLVEALLRSGAEVSGLAAGLHLVATLPDHARPEAEIVDLARGRSVGLYPMSGYRSSTVTGPVRLVVGFGNVRTSLIAEGIARVADLWAPAPARRQDR